MAPHDGGLLLGGPGARGLSEQGAAEARRETVLSDTGAWSLYSIGDDPAAGRESSLHYHRVVTDFLERLCDRVQAGEYCEAARKFPQYEEVAPIVRPLTKRVRAGKEAQLRLVLSKRSEERRVGERV